MKNLFFAWGGIVMLALGLAFVWPQATPDHQEFIIEGMVTNASSKDPLIGVSVMISGGKTGTVTDINGCFALKSPKKCASLAIHYSGFQSKIIKKACAGDKQQIALKEAVSTLDEVVVTRMEVPEEEVAFEDQSLTEAPKPIMHSGASNRFKNSAASIAISPPASTPPPALKKEAIFQLRARPQEPVSKEGYAEIQENAFRIAQTQPTSTFSIDVDAASYSNMRRFLTNNNRPPANAIRVEEMINYFTYDYPQPTGNHPFEVITEMAPCPWQPDHHLLHVGLQGLTIPTTDLPASNLVFLIDVSGSMNRPNKLGLLQESFKLLTDQLRPQDKVAIVVYAGAAGTVLTPTSGADKIKIKEAIGKLRAGGSTAGAAGIQLAYQLARKNFVQDGNNRVILATDGDFNVGVSSDTALVSLIEKERESGVFLTVLGFGMGNYQDGKMQKLADSGNGNHAYIDNIQEAKKVLVSEFGGTVFTIAKDVKLQLEFNPSKVAGYRLIGYENRMLKTKDFDDDKKDAGELGSGHTVTALYEIIPVGVASDFLADIGELTTASKATKAGVDWVSLKLRYKKPTHDSSRLLTVKVNGPATKAPSDNFNWSAAIAAFGMQLRDSEFKGNATMAKTIQLATAAKGKDALGYRTEAIELMRAAQHFLNPEIAEKK